MNWKAQTQSSKQRYDGATYSRPFCFAHRDRNRSQEAQKRYKRHKHFGLGTDFLCLLCSVLCFLWSCPFPLGKAPPFSGGEYSSSFCFYIVVTGSLLQQAVRFN